MRKEYSISGIISLLWFLGTYLILLVLEVSGGAGLWSLLGVSVALLVLGLVIPNRTSS